MLAGDRCWGVCDHDNRTLLFEPTQSRIRLLNTIIHEVAHANFPDEDEAVIRNLADDAAKVLERFGF